MLEKNKFKNYHGQSDLYQNKLAHVWLKILQKFPQLNYKIALLMKIPKNGKILDVGCGNGTFLKFIHTIRPDIKLYGVDVSKDFINEYPHYIRFKEASGDKLPFKSNVFDLVFCQHVLEHVQNPEDFIKEFRRVTKNYIVIITPNYKKTFLWDSSNFWSDPTHIRPFTRTGLKKLFSQAGLKTTYLRDVRDINLPLPALFCLMIYSIFSKKFEFKTVLANLIRYSTIGVAQK